MNSDDGFYLFLCFCPSSILTSLPSVTFRRWLGVREQHCTTNRLTPCSGEQETSNIRKECPLYGYVTRRLLPVLKGDDRSHLPRPLAGHGPPLIGQNFYKCPLTNKPLFSTTKGRSGAEGLNHTERVHNRQSDFRNQSTSLTGMEQDLWLSSKSDEWVAKERKWPITVVGTLEVFSSCGISWTTNLLQGLHSVLLVDLRKVKSLYVDGHNYL